jgi:hypothetical protein
MFSKWLNFDGLEAEKITQDVDHLERAQATLQPHTV